MFEAQILNAYNQGKVKGIVMTDTCFYMPVRITGLGESVRFVNGEPYVENRDKVNFTKESAMNHFANLPIIINHPHNALLNSDNLKDNAIIGNTISAYCKGDEIWGIARIFDKSLINRLNKDIHSTSPALSSFHSLGNDECPLMINHLAFVEKGHWDSAESKGYDDSDITQLIYNIKEA